MKFWLITPVPCPFANVALMLPAEPPCTSPLTLPSEIFPIAAVLPLRFTRVPLALLTLSLLLLVLPLLVLQLVLLPVPLPLALVLVVLLVTLLGVVLLVAVPLPPRACLTQKWPCSSSSSPLTPWCTTTASIPQRVVNASWRRYGCGSGVSGRMSRSWHGFHFGDTLPCCGVQEFVVHEYESEAIGSALLP